MLVEPHRGLNPRYGPGPGENVATMHVIELLRIVIPLNKRGIAAVLEIAVGARRIPLLDPSGRDLETVAS